MNFKENTYYNPDAYSFARSEFNLSLDEIESRVREDYDNFKKEVLADRGIQRRYGDKAFFTEEEWLSKITFLRKKIQYYKKDKFGNKYIRAFRALTLNKALDFNEEAPGVCWSHDRISRERNERSFILKGTGNGSAYVLRLDAVIDQSRIDWVKTIYLIDNDEGELRLKDNTKNGVYILNKSFLPLDIIKSRGQARELNYRDIVDRESGKLSKREKLFLKKCYNKKTKRYDFLNNNESLVLQFGKIDTIKSLIDWGLITITKDFVKINIPLGVWNGNFELDYLNDMQVYPPLINPENLPTKVIGEFYLYSDVKSCEHFPKEVTGNVSLQCKSITSLEGAPQIVGGGFYCYSCHNLKTLKGAPEEVGSDFYIDDCEELRSLEGAPEKVGGNFGCSYCRSLTTLKGAPRKVRGWFNISDCPNLMSTEGIPEDIDDEYISIENNVSLDPSDPYYHLNFRDEPDYEGVYPSF